MNENDSIGYSVQQKSGIGRDLREKYLPFPGKFTMLPYLLNALIFKYTGKIGLQITKRAGKYSTRV